MSGPMTGRRMVVTGAARGIGAAIAADLRRRGAMVLTADVNPEGVDHRCDVSDPDQVESLFVAAGEIHGLVNNAGLIVPRKPLGEITIEEWNRVFAVNVTGAFLCSQAATRPGRMTDGGAIVNVASETAFTGSHGFVHYVATKGAVVSMTRALANELGRARGIRVNCLAPGFADTEGARVLADPATYDTSATPLGRVTTPADLVGTVAFLLGADAAWVTGQTILVNGGRAVR